MCCDTLKLARVLLVVSPQQVTINNIFNIKSPRQKEAYRPFLGGENSL